MTDTVSAAREVKAARDTRHCTALHWRRGGGTLLLVPAERILPAGARQPRLGSSPGLLAPSHLAVMPRAPRPAPLP